MSTASESSASVERTVAEALGQQPDAVGAVGQALQLGGVRGIARGARDRQRELVGVDDRCDALLEVLVGPQEADRHEGVRPHAGTGLRRVDAAAPDPRVVRAVRDHDAAVEGVTPASAWARSLSQHLAAHPELQEPQQYAVDPGDRDVRHAVVAGLHDSHALKVQAQHPQRPPHPVARRPAAVDAADTVLGPVRVDEVVGPKRAKRGRSR